ncbi:MAG: 23S rRNA (adenine(2503)-C(2))-methyltransferase RlmN [Candidatus Enteromonas sp.]|nr:23S rRNA (adenine(2503)-C(2))-methyltransferase RlmN [bacterium]MDD6917389.1 23S rRNA (adenine(2503)-C(2))-methyltransferase RlmN [bacterium]MDY6101380.1 23S rRNA (adenine(2503)-C(2))-methyltransferase RlmN [Candidatus Enteromonas sp.]
MKNLLSFTQAKMKEEFLALGESSYRSKQVFSWIYQKHVYDFDQMSDVSKSFRAKLKEEYSLPLPKIHTRQDARDGTIKLLLEMEDGAKVETVLMRYSYGNVICVSSQVGCNMGCAFCASGLLRKERNLSAGEMIGEVLVMDQVLAEQAESVSHIVVMGTGEPFDNYDNVMDFIRIANDQAGLSIGARHITVSTCGLADGIRKYADEGLQINLAISLHAPNDEIRNQIMPISKGYPMDKLLDAVSYYLQKAGRRVTFEYILLAGVNDSLSCADELADLIHDHHIFAYVNLIPYNPVKEKPYKRSSKEHIHAFADRLLKRGINATVRKEFGNDIDAACGQLRAKVTLGE